MIPAAVPPDSSICSSTSLEMWLESTTAMWQGSCGVLIDSFCLAKIFSVKKPAGVQRMPWKTEVPLHHLRALGSLLSFEHFEGLRNAHILPSLFFLHSVKLFYLCHSWKFHWYVEKYSASQPWYLLLICSDVAIQIVLFCFLITFCVLHINTLNQHCPNLIKVSFC